MSIFKLKSVVSRPRALCAAAIVSTSAALFGMAGVSYADGDAYEDTGVASWYGPRYHGRTTANGEQFDQAAMTAAHRDLPFNSLVEVTNLKNGKSVKVRINDRGPYVGKRIIDVSMAAAERLDFITAGLTPVKVELVGRIQRKKR